MNIFFISMTQDVVIVGIANNGKISQMHKCRASCISCGANWVTLHVVNGLEKTSRLNECISTFPLDLFASLTVT